jgi:hypothetical protein
LAVGGDSVEFALALVDLAALSETTLVLESLASLKFKQFKKN